MSSPTAKSVSAIFAILLAAGPLATASNGAPAEAECLSGPKGAAPAGGHWYYRVDRATKRACWYVGNAKDRPTRVAAQTAPPPSSAASPPNTVNEPSSIANARAEWPLPQSRVEREASVFTAPRPLATVAGAISPEKDPPASADDTGVQRSVVASRWVLAGSSTPASPEPSTDNTAPTPAPAKAAPTPALPLAAADASSTEKPVGSVHMLLIAILGALALAGLLASAIFRLSGQRRNKRRGDRRVNWDSVRSDRPSLSDEARARTAADQDERIAQLLGRPQRTAT